MSSGSYVYQPTYQSYEDKINANLERLSVEESNVASLYEETMNEIRALKKTLSSVKAINKNSTETEKTIELNGLFEGEQRTLYSGLSTEELVFADIDTSRGEIVYIALDYSDCLSVRNAINSSEYKKLQLADEINKSVMLIPVATAKTEERINSFLELLHETLDDENVDFDYFSNYITPRFESIRKDCIPTALDITTDEWKEYCALCALVGQHPKYLSDEKITQQTDLLKKTFLENKYIEKARNALYETLEELGLTVIDSYSLDSVDGTLVGNSANSGCKLFVSEQNDNFVLEAIEEKDSSPSEKTELCEKRKAIAKIMERKGFPLGVLNESENYVSASAIKQKSSKERSAVERARLKRTLAGNKPKARVIGR